MKKLLPLLCCVFLFASTKAQYVNIPDSNFRNRLIIYYPTCFDTLGKMDTTCNTIVNAGYLELSGNAIKSIEGIQYFKKLTYLSVAGNSLSYVPRISDSITEFRCYYNQIKINYITNFPVKLKKLTILSDSLDNFPTLPNGIEELDCSENLLTSLPNLPNSIKIFNCSSNKISTLQTLPISLTNFACFNNILTTLPSLPAGLLSFNCSNNNLTALPTLPNNLTYLICNNNLLTALPSLANTISIINCSSNKLTSLPPLPSSLIEFTCNYNPFLHALPQMPSSLFKMSCSYNDSLDNIVSLSNSIKYLTLNNNNFSQLPQLPQNLSELYCANNKLIILPNLPSSLRKLGCENNFLSHLPNLPDTLSSLRCDGNFLSEIPRLPRIFFKSLICYNNPYLFCLPKLPTTLSTLMFDDSKIKCISQQFSSFVFGMPTFPNPYPVCNTINNINKCSLYPTITGNVFFDLNNNGVKDSIDFGLPNIKIQLSTMNYAFTDYKGNYRIESDTIGIGTLSIVCPNFIYTNNTSYNYKFNSYDSVLKIDFALRPSQIKDSISIKLTPTNWAARAGRSYPYLVSYENVGTTVLSNATVSLSYNNNLLNYDSAAVTGVTNSGSKLSVNVGNLLPGQTGSFMAYFTVKSTAVFNNSFTSVANVITNTVNAADTVKSIVSGSYDPNDKHATPSLTLQEVSSGKHIDYTIRFQNTGTDTAFNVVIADTLNNKLLGNQVQMVGASHPCKTTVKDNIIFFEFLDIMLPDSNVNKFGSNGFVSFKIKPIVTVTDGTIIPNKAAIYFDYNSPVITKPANTIIQNTLPLQLLSLSAIPQNELNKILVYWNTVNEVNTGYFIIETSSNGINFKAVAEVVAKGIGSNGYFYSIDKSSVVYVRLKMVDKDGHYTYSNLIKLGSNVEELNGLMVLQNPTKNQLQLKVSSSSLYNTRASLTNAEGRVVKRFILKQGYQTIDISGIAAGLYYLQSNEGSKKVVIIE